MKQSLDEILEEIGRSSLLSIDEERALCKAVQEKGIDSDEMKQLEKANMRFIVSVAAQYQKRGLTLEELIEAGTEGLRKAAMKYDTSRCFKFIVYAVWWIRQSILQAIKEKEKCDEEQASSIDDPAILQELCDKGNKYAAYELYHKCRWGDEENGIFINKREAKHYFDLAGDVPQQYEEEWDDVDDPGEECPEKFCYTLTGNAQTLDGVEKLINDLCQQFGTPGNELGLYVPQQMLMKLLVGSDSIYYRGNVISMERQAPDTLVITTDADKGEPLLYAMRECFENLNVEMK